MHFHPMYSGRNYNPYPYEMYPYQQFSSSGYFGMEFGMYGSGSYFQPPPMNEYLYRHDREYQPPKFRQSSLPLNDCKYPQYYADPDSLKQMQQIKKETKQQQKNSSQTKRQDKQIAQSKVQPLKDEDKLDSPRQLINKRKKKYRQMRVKIFREKKKRRKFGKKFIYPSRKKVADAKPRSSRGRFLSSAQQEVRNISLDQYHKTISS